jgi:hypothetical protein
MFHRAPKGPRSSAGVLCSLLSLLVWLRRDATITPLAARCILNAIFHETGYRRKGLNAIIHADK